MARTSFGIILGTISSNAKSQRLSEPLLYRYLRISSTNVLRKLVKAFDTQQTTGKDCGRWVWGINVDLDNPKKHLLDLNSIMSRCITLQQVHGAPVAYCAVLSLRAIPGPTLRTMSISFDPYNLYSMGQIDRFKNLWDLCIAFFSSPGSWDIYWYDGHEAQSPPSDIPPWTLPQLQTLHLIPAANREPVDLRYLAQWSFPALKSFAMNGFHQRELDAEIKHLASFLNAHPHISCLYLEDLRRMLPLIPHVRCPELRMCLTELGEVSRNMMQLLRPEVVRLRLSYNCYHADALWTLLDAICTQPKGLRRVDMGVDADRTYSYHRKKKDWIEEHRSRMEEYASVLQPMGVQLTQEPDIWQHHCEIVDE
jgi:hypothetical protein